METGLAIAFAGTPDLAAVILKRLLEDSRHRVMQVFTQPDRRAGRGRRPQPSPVKRLAGRYGIPVSQPAGRAELVGDPGFGQADLLAVAAYGLILPEAVITAPRHGSVNVHTSLLPRWRGAAPIQRAIEAGDEETGISIMQMDAGMDTGPILLQEPCIIRPDETAGSLTDRLARLGAECLLRALDRLVAGELQPQPQDDSRATYAPKVTKAEAEIDWSLPAATLERKVRAFNPAPVAHTVLSGQPLRVWEARVLVSPCEAPAGGIVGHSPDGLDVATGSGVLRILSLQLPGKRVMSSREFYNGNPGFGR